MTDDRRRTSARGGPGYLIRPPSVLRLPSSDVRPLSSIHRPPRSGFTLIEVLVVVFIGLLVAALAAPSFSRALQAQRLRTSARTVVTIHKYARNMAVLRQQPMAVLFDRIGQVVEVVAVADRSGLSARGGFLEDRSRMNRSEPKVEKKVALDEEEAPPPAKMESIELRALSDAVRIVDLKSDGDIFHRDGVYWVNYYPSGMSDGFTLRLQDERKKEATIKADPISGGAEVEFDED